MNEDEERQDGDQSILMDQIESAQKMLDNLKSLLAEKKKKENKDGPDNILTSLKQSIYSICDDAETKLSVPGTSTTDTNSVENGPPEIQVTQENENPIQDKQQNSSPTENVPIQDKEQNSSSTENVPIQDKEQNSSPTENVPIQDKEQNSSPTENVPIQDEEQNSSSTENVPIQDKEQNSSPTENVPIQDEEQNSSSTENVPVKEENECRVGTIKVRNLSFLMDPNRNKVNEEETLIILSDSEDDCEKTQNANIKTTENPIKKTNIKTAEKEQPKTIEKSRATVKTKRTRTVIVPETSSSSSSSSSSSDDSDNDNACDSTDRNSQVTCKSKSSSINAGTKRKDSPRGRSRKISSSSDSDVPTEFVNASPTKSILKSPDKLSKSLDKKVQFSENDALVHTYANNLASSSGSSSYQDTSSDDDFTVNAPQKKKLRQRNVKQVVDVDEQIRQDKKFLSQCVVNVQRFSTEKLLDLYLKGKEDEIITDETKRLRNMDGLKRKRTNRNSDLSSDSDVKQMDKKHKKNEKKREKEERRQKKEDKRQKKAERRHKRAQEEKKHKSKVVLNSSDDEASDNEKIVANNGATSTQQDVERDSDTQDEQGAANIDNNDQAVNDQEMEKDGSDIESGQTNDFIGEEAEVEEKSDSEEESMSAKKKKKKSKKAKAKRMLSDSDDSASEKNATKSDSSSSSEESDDEESPKKSSHKKSNKRSRIKKVEDSSDEEEKTTRKQIRKVLSRDSLADTTKRAEKEEAARKARIAERQQKYNNIFDADSLESSTLTKVVLDFNEETQEEILKVDKELVKHLKPHQGKGVQFMWDACFESIDRATSTEGSGCILAHCMGLGKTLQVIALIHTLLANQDKTEVKKVLVVCPLSTVLNWVSEFKQWLPDDDEVQVYNLVAYKQNRERACHVMDWHTFGGVMVLGYDMFRNLSNEANKRISKKMRNDFKIALVDPGPQLVVCDEGHLLKNEKTSISKAVNNIASARRIVLTGTPLQNNLKEYYCMVQFVKKNLLGTYKEYLNRFVNPITNGQYTDSTQADIQLMRKRSHVLHKLLDGIVQRRDYSVLAPFLPPKHEYIIFISLTETQINLYRHYLLNFAQRSSGPRTSFLFTDFQELQRICTHPRVLLDKSIQNRIAQEKKDWDNENDEDSEGSLKDFIDDGSDSESEAKSTSSSGSDNDGGSDTAAKVNAPKVNKFRRRTRAMADKDPEPEPDPEVAAATSDQWWSQFTAGDELDNIIHSGKLTLLFEILHQCELIGDKVLVFSQSLLSLNVIEYFLARIDEGSQSGDVSMVKGYSSSWSLGLDYFRLDGSSSCDNRASWCKTFNNANNTRARLFLISTRAGGLGINLVAANRVIIFDVSWNPSHDIQSIYRVYRFGQIKPSYIYRFVTMGTMEMKIYERQVTKQAISKRVIDEQQIDRHYNQTDLQELYKFEPQPDDRPLPAPPKDILLGELLQNFNNLIFKYHEHHTLLENKEDEVLNEEERKAAWEEFENEKKMQKSSTGTINNIPMHTVVQALASIIKREHPAFTPFEINGVMPQLIAELRGQIANGEMSMFNKMLAEIRSIKAAEQVRVQEYYQQQQNLWMMQQMQRQYPTFSTSDREKILTQFQNRQLPDMNMMGMGGGTTTAIPNRLNNLNINNPNEVVNLEED